MSARFVNLDRQTPMFLPCDLREWIPEGHIVHFILDAVEQLPLARFHVNHRGTGSEQYPPAMMLALVIYCYATGRFGSRTIEAATHSDVAVRYICANTHPDHDSIRAFRGAENVRRVQQWRAAHPGYWKRRRKQPPGALQELCEVKTPLLVGLIAQFSDAALQEDIVTYTRRLIARGQDILDQPSRRLTKGNIVYDAKENPASGPAAAGAGAVQLD